MPNSDSFTWVENLGKYINNAVHFYFRWHFILNSVAFMSNKLILIEMMIELHYSNYKNLIFRADLSF